MVTVLGSEIPYGFFLLMGLYAFGWGFRNLTEKENLNNWRRYLYFLGGGLFFGVSQFIRPVTFPYLILLTLFMLFGFRYFILTENAKDKPHFLNRYIIPFTTTWFSFFATAILLYWASGYGVTFAPRQKGLWNLYIGFNVETKGIWNIKDSDLIGKLGMKYDWDGENTNRDFYPIVLNRVKENWFKNLKILPEKLYLLLDPQGIPFWAVEQSNVNSKEKVYKILKYFRWVNGLVLAISLGTWIVCFTRRSRPWDEFFAFCALGSTFVYLIAHGYFLEVQGRYSNHLWMIMFICFPVSISILKQSFIPIRKGNSVD
jgi:hypothetical protein